MNTNDQTANYVSPLARCGGASVVEQFLKAAWPNCNFRVSDVDAVAVFVMFTLNEPNAPCIVDVHQALIARFKAVRFKMPFMLCKEWTRPSNEQLGQWGKAMRQNAATA